MITSLLWGLFNSLFGTFVAWAIACSAAYLWLREHPTPIRRWAWALFLALVVRVLFNPVQFFAIGLLSMDTHPTSQSVLTGVRLILTLLIWALATKMFFRNAGIAQVLFTALLGVADDVLVITRSYAWVLHRGGLIHGA